MGLVLSFSWSDILLGLSVVCMAGGIGGGVWTLLHYLGVRRELAALVGAFTASAVGTAVFYFSLN